MNKVAAYIQAIRKADEWDGAVIVRDGSGFDVIPQAHLDDISYTGSRKVVTVISSSSDFLGGDFTAADLTDEQIEDAVNALL